MTDIFIRVLEISAVSSAVIFAVLMFRAVLGKRVRQGVLGMLWALVLLRLCVPFTLESPVHISQLIPPKQEAVQEQPTYTDMQDTVVIADNGIDNAVVYYEPEDGYGFTPHSNIVYEPDTVSQPAAGNTAIDWLAVAAYTWAAGAAIILLGVIVRSILFGRRVKRCGEYEEGAQLADDIRIALNIKRNIPVRICNFTAAPVLLGLLRPQLLLPENCRNVSGNTLRCILAHELCHVKRLDILKGYIWLAVKAVHWFNPFVWIAYSASKDDVELCCDDMVLRHIGKDCRFMYTQSLIDVFRSYKRALPITVPFFGGKPNLTERVIRMLKPNKRSKAAAALSIFLALVIAVAGFTTACFPAQPAAATEIPTQTAAAQPSAEQSNSETTTPAPSQTPEPYTVSQWTDTINKDKRTLDINAQVTIPNVSEFPVYLVKNAPVTQDTVDKLKAYFFGDAAVYKYTNRMQLEEDLKSSTAEYNAMLDGTYKFSEGEDKKKLMRSDKLHIDAVKKLIKKEPDTGLVPLNLNLSTNKDYNIEGITAAGDRIYVSTGMPWIHISKYDPNLEETVNLDFVGPLTPAKMTEEEAKAKAQELLNELGLFDFKFNKSKSAFIRANVKVNNDQINGDSDKNLYVYNLVFTRIVGGIQLASAYSRPELADNDIKILRKIRDNFFEETIRITVNDSGIWSFDWQAPFSTEPAGGNAQLMDIEKIKQIVTGELMKKYEAIAGQKESFISDAESFTLHVKLVKLEYARVPVNGDYDTPYLVPVWNVYTTNTKSYWRTVDGIKTLKNYDSSFTTVELTINALDGSVIGTQSNTN